MQPFNYCKAFSIDEKIHAKANSFNALLLMYEGIER